MAKHVTAYIGLGGNVGDVVSNMQSALQILNAHEHIEVTQVSNVYKTPPWGIENQDWFLNACACLETSLTAQELLEACLEIEIKLKRVREVRWGPRTIDLDVLVFGDEQINQKNLQVPHPRMHERAFVLKPMANLAPDLKLQNKTISEWLNDVEASGIEKTDYKLSLQSS